MYSKLSFFVSLITLILFFYLFNLMPSTIRADENFPSISKWMIAATQLSCLTGLIFTIISFIKKEKIDFLKVTGAILNFLIFILLIGLILVVFAVQQKNTLP